MLFLDPLELFEMLFEVLTWFISSFDKLDEEEVIVELVVPLSKSDACEFAADVNEC